MQMLEKTARPQTVAAYDSHLLGGVGKLAANYTEDTYVTLVDSIFDYYAGCLDIEHRALRRLQRMGITDRSLLRQLSVGISNRTLGLQLPDVSTPEGAQVRGALERLGLSLASGGEFFRGALVFPLRNLRGEIVEAYGQRLTPRHNANTESQLYWSLGSARFFNHLGLEGQAEVIICETPFQAVVLISQGFTNAVAPVGRWGFNELQLDAIERAMPDCVKIAYSDSFDGQRAAGLVGQAIEAIGVKVKQCPMDVKCAPRRPPVPFNSSDIEPLHGQALVLLAGRKNLHGGTRL